MKYNVGDKVVIGERQAEIAAKKISDVKMLKTLASLMGQEVTIFDITANRYYLIVEDGQRYSWGEDMFEDIEREYNVEEISVLYG